MQFNLSDYFEQQVLPKELHPDRRLSTQIENIGASAIIGDAIYKIGIREIKGEDVKKCIYYTLFRKIKKRFCRIGLIKNNITLDKDYNIEKSRFKFYGKFYY